MNRLKKEKQEQVISCLVNGNSIRATERITGTNRNTIMSLLVRVGSTCKTYMNQEFRELDCKRIQVDEIWTYVGKKKARITADDDKSQVGDFYTFVAVDADTRLVPSFLIGKRDLESTQAFIYDLESRLKNRIQLSSDGWGAYIAAIDESFGVDVDYAQIVKSFQAEPKELFRQYAPPKVVDVKKSPIVGEPEPVHISTSYVERQNLTMRMNMRRFTRLTNAFSKKLDNLKAAVALHFMYYNFVRIHQTLKVTPAMEAGITGYKWSTYDLLSL